MDGKNRLHSLHRPALLAFGLHALLFASGCHLLVGEYGTGDADGGSGTLGDVQMPDTSVLDHLAPDSTSSDTSTADGWLVDASEGDAADTDAAVLDDAGSDAALSDGAAADSSTADSAAGDAAVADAAPPPPQVQGFVRDAVTSLPLAGVEVVAYSSPLFAEVVAVSDSNGAYELGGVRPGLAYLFTRNSLGYFNQLRDGIRLTARSSIYDGTPFLALDGVTIQIDFDLDPGASIGGAVYAAGSADPIAQATVVVLNEDQTSAAICQTDSDGVFRSHGLAAGTYYALAFASSGYGTQLFEGVRCDDNYTNCLDLPALPIPLGQEQFISDVDFDLVQLGFVTGQITDAVTSLPVQGVYIMLLNDDGRTAGHAVSGANGRYSSSGLNLGMHYAVAMNNLGRGYPLRPHSSGYIDALYDGSFCFPFCTPTDGTPIAVVGGMETGGVDFALDTGGAIVGQVTDQNAGTPMADVSVWLKDQSGDNVTSCTSGGDGSYGCYGLLPGRYYVVTSNRDGMIDELYPDLPCGVSCELDAGTLVDVSASAETAGIDFSLLPGGRIEGRISDASTGAAIEDVQVSVLGADGYWYDTSLSDENGAYRTQTGLPSGTYYAVVYSANGQGYFGELYQELNCDQTCTVVSGDALTVTAPDTVNNVDFTLRRGASISGTVTDALGAPQRNVEVKLHTLALYIRSEDTDALGAYSFAPLPAASYTVSTANHKALLDELYDDLPCAGLLACSEGQGTPVILGEGLSVSGVDFALDSGAAFRAHVTSIVDASPLRATVSIYNTAGQLMDYTATSNNGFALSTGLPAGDYFLLVEDPEGFYASKVYPDIPCAWPCDATVGEPVTLVGPGEIVSVSFELAAQ